MAIRGVKGGGLWFRKSLRQPQSAAKKRCSSLYVGTCRPNVEFVAYESLIHEVISLMKHS